MFERILDLQRQEYGSQDSRCFVTVDKINMVKSSGTKFEEAVAELRKTFSLPETDVVPPPPPLPPQESNDTRIAPTPRGGLTPAGRPKKNKVMKVLTAIRKKK
jgi:hypothetical protein